MARKKKSKPIRTLLLVIFLLGITLIGVGAVGTYTIFSGNAQSFSIANDLSQNTVYTPVFSRTSCDVIEPNNEVVYDWAERQDQNGWITEYCSRNDHTVYTNRCELEINRENQGFFSSSATIKELYICPVGTKFENKENECRQVDGTLGTFSFSNDEYILARASDNFGFGAVDSNELEITKVADWYGLRTIDSNNYLTQEVTCDVSRIENKGFTFLQSEKDNVAPNGVLEFNKEMQYISAQRPVASKNVIEYRGEEVWTIGNQEYCEIEEDVNGIRFVNIQKCRSASDLICNPALPYCSDDGTEIINIDSSGDEEGSGKTCNELFGSFTNQFVPNPNNPSEVCQTSCGSDGTLQQDYCKAIPQCGNGETLNQNYVCVSANVPQGEEEESSYLFLGMIVAGLLLAGVSQRGAMEG